MRGRICTVLLVLGLGMLAPAGSALAGERVTIAIGGSSASAQYLPIEIAHALGFFREQGLDVDVQYVASGTLAATALIGGSVDFSGNAFDHVVKAAVRGKALKGLAVFTEVPGLLFLVSNAYRETVRDPRDLKGRPIGVSAFGAASDMVVRYVLTRSGLTRDEINTVPVGTDGLAPGLENGRLQATVAAGTMGARLVETGRAFVLLDLRSRAVTESFFGGPYAAIGLLTRAEVVAEQPERCAKVVRAIVKATRWIASHSAADVAAALPPAAVPDRRLYAAAVEENRDGFSKTGRVDPRGIETVIAAHRASGAVPEGHRIDPAALYDNRFVDQALAGGS